MDLNQIFRFVSYAVVSSLLLSQSFSINFMFEIKSIPNLILKCFVDYIHEI